MSLVHFSVLAALFIGRLLVDIYLTQRFIIAWRMWLTGHLTDDWLDGRAYYRDLFIDNTIDNPDQRIQQDVDIFTAGAGGTPEHPVQRDCEHAAVRRGAVRWSRWSRLPRSCGICRGRWTSSASSSPRAMFWIVVVYVLIATVVAFWLGRPLIWLSFNNEKLNAAFRYALVRLRDAAEAVGFYRGERVERTQLWRPLHPDHRQLPQIRPPDHRRSTAGTGRCRRRLCRCRGSFRRRGCSPGQIAFGDVDADRDGVRQDQRFVVVLPQQLRRVRRLPRGDHPVARTGRRQRQGPRAARGADPAHRRRVGRVRRRRGAHTRRRPVDRFAGRAPGIRSTRW